MATKKEYGEILRRNLNKKLDEDRGKIEKTEEYKKLSKRIKFLQDEISKFQERRNKLFDKVDNWSSIDSKVRDFTFELILDRQKQHKEKIKLLKKYGLYR